MIETAARGILLDIEGTTSSVSFVYDVMFSFVRRELDTFLDDHWSDSGVVAACNTIAHDAGHASLDAWQNTAGGVDVKKLVIGEVVRLMDDDVKATGLKQLQGLIWKSGFDSGELLAHVYDDVKPAIERWRSADVDVRIYSSGSAAAQKLFFGHTIVGNLLSLFGGHYDTTTGGKKEADSYHTIAADFNLPAEQILFLSDVVAELDAARAAGMQTALCTRPGNAEVAPGHGHPVVTSFDEIELAD